MLAQVFWQLPEHLGTLHHEMVVSFAGAETMRGRGAKSLFQPHDGQTSCASVQTRLVPQTCQPSSARVAVIDNGLVVVRKITLVLGAGTVGAVVAVAVVRAEAVVAVSSVLAARAVGARIGAALVEVVLTRIAVPARE